MSCLTFFFVKSCNENNNFRVISPPDIVTYERNIKPLLTTYCTPCHYAGGISPYKWENYEAVKYKISIIIERVNKDQGAKHFMPKDGTKLSAKSIAMLRKWVADGTLER
jgi:hypothetical protein